MPAPEGQLIFGGLDDYESFEVSTAHGITPSVFTVTTVPGKFRIDQGRTLTLRYGSTVITFPQCKIDKAEVITGADGKQRLQLTILDRRWKWQEAPGAISGVYNVRKDDGTDDFVPGTERTPRQLAELLLDAAGEFQRDVSKLPNQDRPQVEWEYAEPMAELARLAESYGCRVVLKLNNSVSLEPLGVGAQLPTIKLETSNDGLDPPERPDRLILVCGRTEHQLDLELEAVGEDVDGMFKPFNQLSYFGQLANGFVDIDIPFFSMIANKQVRALAQRSIYKAYRIKTPFTVPRMEPNGPPIVVNDLKQILPLLDRQVELKRPAQGTPPKERKEEPLPPWVYGIWCNAESGYANVTNTIDPTVQANDKSKGFYADGFTVDVERGIVFFNDHVFRTKPPIRPGDTPIIVTADGRREKGMAPAVLRLRIAINLRDNNRAYFHYERVRGMPGPQYQTRPRYITNYQQSLKFITRYTPHLQIASTTSNQGECNKFADLFLDAAQREYQTKTPQVRTYAGFLGAPTLDLDGAIQQISWFRGADGFARTRATRDTEEIVLQPSYKENRQQERLNEIQPGIKPPAKVQEASFSLGKIK